MPSARLGPGGSFLAHKHTRKHMRERWQPTLIDRRPYNIWEEKRDGARDWAREKAQQILRITILRRWIRDCRRNCRESSGAKNSLTKNNQPKGKRSWLTLAVVNCGIAVTRPAFWHSAWKAISSWGEFRAGAKYRLPKRLIYACLRPGKC